MAWILWPGHQLHDSMTTPVTMTKVPSTRNVDTVSPNTLTESAMVRMNWLRLESSGNYPAGVLRASAVFRHPDAWIGVLMGGGR